MRLGPAAVLVLLAACEGADGAAPLRPAPLLLAGGDAQAGPMGPVLSASVGPRMADTGGSGGSGGTGGDGGAGGTGDTGGSGGDGGSAGTGGSPPDHTLLTFQDMTEVAQLPGHMGLDFLGSGVALFDWDGDGDLDVLVTDTLQAPTLMRNDGAFRFTDVTAATGIRSAGFTNGVSVGDCDGDGKPDLAFTSHTAVMLLHLMGTQYVQEPSVALPAGSQDIWPTSVLWADLDGDGDLDLYVATSAARFNVPQAGQDLLYLNDGSCHFTEQGRVRGIDDTGFTYAAAIFDADHDGDPDIFTANDYGTLAEGDHFFRNDGRGFFSRAEDQVGLAEGLYGMSASVGDVNDDGILDIYVGNACRNLLYLGTSRGRFVESARDLNVAAAWYVDPEADPQPMPYFDPQNPHDAPYAKFQELYGGDRPDDPRSVCTTTWEAALGDLDADGRTDVAIANGSVGLGAVPEGVDQPAMLFWHRPDGTFEDATDQVGFADRGGNRVVLFADLDGDGKLDILTSGLSTDGMTALPTRVFRNTTRDADMGHHLTIHLQGTAPNLWGEGAEVEVRVGAAQHIALQHTSGYLLSANAAPIYVGLGAAEKADEVIVRWPSRGGQNRLLDVPAGDVTVVQGSSSP